MTLITIGVYAPGMHGPFIFDDLSNITNNSLLRIQTFDWDSLIASASSGSAGPLKRPIPMLSFALNYYAAGGEYNSFVFKLTNIAIQCLCGLLLFTVFRQVLNLTPIRQPSDMPRAWMAAGIATLWLIHPINLTSVLYIVQRMTSLSTLFSLICISAYLAGRTRWNRQGWDTQSLGLFCLSSLGLILALYSKENAILIPLIICWIEFTILSTTKPWQHLQALSKQQRFWLLMALIVCCLGGLAYAIDYAGGGFASRPFSMLERVLTEARVVCFYLSLILIPRINAFGLFHDDIELSTSILSPWTTLPSILLLAALVASAFYFRKKNPLYALGIGWFLIGHALESTFFALEIAHEHRNHFPSIGIILAAVSWVPYTQANKTKVISGFLFVALILGGTTWMRATQWANYQRLAYYEAEHSPKSHAIQALLSNAAHQVGDIETATRAIKNAMDLAPDEIAYSLHYQNILAISGQPIPANVQQETLHRIQNNLISPSTQLALDHIAGCLTKAPCAPLIQNYLQWIDEIIVQKPNKAYYQFLKGKAHRANNDELEALNAFQRAHELDEKYLHPLFEMADILIRARQTELAKQVIGWIEVANEKTSFRRDKELAKLKTILQNMKKPTTEVR